MKHEYVQLRLELEIQPRTYHHAIKHRTGTRMKISKNVTTVDRVLSGQRPMFANPNDLLFVVFRRCHPIKTDSIVEPGLRPRKQCWRRNDV